MAVTTRQIRAALTRRGLRPIGRLRVIVDGRIITDTTTVVVKIQHDDSNAFAYLDDLDAYARADIPAERPLLREPLRIGDQVAVVVAYEYAVEPTAAHHAEQVGQLLRRIHDRIWPFTQPPNGQVYCPDDWHPRNIIITTRGPVMIDLDLSAVLPRSRAVAQAIDDFGRPFRRPPWIREALLRGYGHHPDLTNRHFAAPPPAPPFPGSAAHRS